ncbi:conjugative transfer ATPase [Corticibacter populi]|uniref:Conjugative transfer ATPase n=1 Tax=Corticibacter populi TaxID=1550736 RepID=A0A3M6QYQ7_9BURK|nr:conjugative transfer ATPase [Corticibacter populi]RMX08147.1 conjugative transfer ATPase [Corticibacter populi]RZS35404.1 conjugative transfer ATPase [Corticibacter populi]
MLDDIFKLFGLGTDRNAASQAASQEKQAEEKQADPIAGGQSATPAIERQRRERPLTIAYRRKMAERPPSFTELLPYKQYLDAEQVFVMEDGATVGAMLELTPISTESRTEQDLQAYRMKIQDALQAIPEAAGSPWIVQFYLSDDQNVTPLKERLQAYIQEVHKVYPERAKAIRESRYTRAVLAEFDRHIDLASRPEGLFTDTLVTGQTWRAQLRRVRCCIYRRFGAMDATEANTASQQVNAAVSMFTSALAEAGIASHRGDGKDFYEWLMPFFNPAPKFASNVAEALKVMPYTDGKTPPGRPPLFGFDIAESLSASRPRSDLEAGIWEFDGRPYKALVLQALQRDPQIGHFSAERREDKHFYARFDRLPPGSMLSITIVVEPQYKVQGRVERIRDASRAKTAVAMQTHAECEGVLQCMSTGEKLFPAYTVLYVTAADRKALDDVVNQASTSLTSSGMKLIDPRQDLVPLDEFIRGLPFNYDHAFDTKFLRRQRLIFASQLAAMLPVYGRARGTNNPGMWFWNRGGEPIWMDPLSKHDRKKNAHMLVFGPTGAGKSATLNYLSMLTMAVHRPRLVIVDAGRSFSLLMNYFAEMGLSTYSAELTSYSDVSLPPFVHALRLLDDPDVMGSYLSAEQQARTNAGLPDDEAINKLAGGDDVLDAAEDDEDDSELQKRDLLGEMLIAAIMMITGGETAEVARMGRADRYLISTAIIRAAMQCRDEGRAHPLAQDVALQLMGMNKDPSLSAVRQLRAEEMGQAMMPFTQGLRGRIFNRVGTDWPDVDVTLVEMGTLTQDGYGDAMALAYTSLIDAVQSRGERTQADDRPIIFLTDEGHLITTNELLGPKIAKGTKMWRKLGIWFWLATQNLADFPASMSRVLSMCEYWMLLTMDKSEIEEIARFRALSPEQRQMIESARKEPPKFTEGVMISAGGQVLFRNVPPSLPIALAMTEKHEKAQRRRLMEEHGVNEMDAAVMVARQLEKARE